MFQLAACLQCELAAELLLLVRLQLRQLGSRRLLAAQRLQLRLLGRQLAPHRDDHPAAPLEGRRYGSQLEPAAALIYLHTLRTGHSQYFRDGMSCGVLNP